MKIRQERRNGRNLYLQLGDEPADGDPCLGFIIDPAVAALLADGVNGTRPGGSSLAELIRDTLAAPEA